VRGRNGFLRDNEMRIAEEALPKLPVKKTLSSGMGRICRGARVKGRGMCDSEVGVAVRRGVSGIIVIHGEIFI
jgi:hypothetical protein